MNRTIKLVTFVCMLALGCGRAPTVVQPSPPKQAVLPADVLDEIDAIVRMGFYERGDIAQMFLEELYKPGELDEQAVSAAIDEAIGKLNDAKKRWPAVTDCDRLDKAFEALNTRGIVAMQNAGYTQSDGYDEFLEAYANHPKKSEVIGYCFYHWQDLAGAVHGRGLFLAFGPADPEREETEGTKVGTIVREELERAGLEVQWTGTFASRMSLPKFVWQRR